MTQQRLFTTWKSLPGQIKKFDPDEVKLLKARFENAPIADYPAAYFNTSSFKERLLSWTSLCGIREASDFQTIIHIVDFFRNRVNGLTFEEIHEALWMNVMGVFKDKIEAFNAFDVRYLASVTAAYNRHRKALDKKYKECLENLPKEPVVMTPAQRDFSYIEWVTKAYEIWLAEPDMIPGAPTLYDNLVRMEVIEEDKMNIEKYVKQAKDRYELSVTDGRVSSDKRNWIAEIIKDQVKFETHTLMEAQTSLLTAWFQKMKEGNTSLPDLLVQNFNRRHHPFSLSLTFPNTPSHETTKQGGETA